MERAEAHRRLGIAEREECALPRHRSACVPHPHLSAGPASFAASGADAGTAGKFGFRRRIPTLGDWARRLRSWLRLFLGDFVVLVSGTMGLLEVRFAPAANCCKR